MASLGRNRAVVGVLGFLADHRMVAYFGGLLAILTPTLLQRSGVSVSPTMRTAVVLASLAVMVATYVGERRFAQGHAGGNETVTDTPDSDTASPPAYSRRTRLLVALAVAGLAVGIYVATEVSYVAGVVFVFGAYLFGYFAFQGDDDGN